ncbi:PA0069 family radical SAM protein [Enterovirga rhinocerotis]|uniref:DNA repair photolyase n=1 Tax=Enterovirga rhinocerotis TaxID=1339210 RepID=A0A4R7C741_9HYPH|nr:PA0069 family radical SAM protein [Enterovirga rhinocerotis]TDR93782.1 DNA repair photolyase [Enterovirga rhinocerotis]
MVDTLLRPRNFIDGTRPAPRVPAPVIDRRRPDLRTYGPVETDRRRGRGATANPDGRYEPVQRERIDDGWDIDEEIDDLRTEVTIEKPRTIITKNDSPDIGFDRSINPYRGCEHGCVYCFARPSHAYQGLSPGLDFETKLFAKPNAPELLRKELSAPGYEPRMIAMGTNTDPYQPIERHYRITRQVLEVLEEAGHPVGIVTKSALVTRDIDILSRMAERGLAKVALSVTTLDPRLARRMEPRAATPTKRLSAIRQLTEAGIPVSVLVAPLIPAINDHEIESILRAAYASGAREAGYVLLRLPHELKGIVRDWLAENYPDRMKHVLSLVEETRGGKLYDSAFGQRQTGVGPYAWMIGRRFEAAAGRLGFNTERTRLRTDLFRRPAKETGQLALF